MSETALQEIHTAPDDYIPPDELQTNDYNYRITIEDIIYCIDVLKLNVTQTAKRLECSHSNISQRLTRYKYNSGDLDKFKNNQADLYSIRRLRFAKHMTDEKIEKMSAYQLTGMDSMVLNQERLIRGESTENIAYADMTRAQELVDKQLASFRDKYGIKADDTG
jgi:hypothetical protein